jgi:hypothetical protein
MVRRCTKLIVAVRSAKGDSLDIPAVWHGKMTLPAFLAALFDHGAVQVPQPAPIRLDETADEQRRLRNTYVPTSVLSRSDVYAESVMQQSPGLPTLVGNLGQQMVPDTFYSPRFRGIKYFNGISLRERFPQDATVEVRTERPPTDFFRAGVFWIISSKLRSILESHGVEAEYLSVRLVNRSGHSLGGDWWCFDPTVVLDWFDWLQSEYVPEQNFATDIKTVRAKQGVLTDLPLAVAERTIPDLVAVSNGLAASIVHGGCIGVLFRDPQDWQNPVNPVIE